MKISRRLEQDAQTRGKAGGMCQMHKQEAQARGISERPSKSPRGLKQESHAGRTSSRPK